MRKYGYYVLLSKDAFFLYFRCINFKILLNSFLELIKSRSNLFINLNNRRLFVQIQMYKVHQGTTVHVHNGPEELVQDIKPNTNSHLSGMKGNHQNPQGNTPDDKQVENHNLRYRMSKLWTQLSTLKKGLTIGGIALFIIIVILFTLLMVSLRTKTRFIILEKQTSPFPNSNDDLIRYLIQMNQRRLFRNDTNTNVTITTVQSNPTKARVAQQNNQGQDLSLLFAVLQFPQEDDGIYIKKTGEGSLQAIVDMDKLIKASLQDRRLLFELQMKVALRKMQEKEQGTQSINNFNAILKGAQDSLKQTVAQALQATSDQIQLTTLQVVSIIKNEDQKNTLHQESKQNSRLLYALAHLRNMQQEYWQDYFSKMLQGKFKQRLDKAQTLFKQIKDNLKSNQNEEVNRIFLKSNLNEELELKSSEPQGDTTRLLQQDKKDTNSPDSNLNQKQSAPIDKQADASLKDNPNADKNQKKDQLSNEIKGQVKKFQKKWVTVTVTVSGSVGFRAIKKCQYDDCLKCCKKGNKTQCDKSVVTNPQSIHFVEGANEEQFNTKQLYSVKKGKKPKPKQKKQQKNKQSSKDKQNKKKNNVQQKGQASNVKKPSKSKQTPPQPLPPPKKDKADKVKDQASNIKSKERPLNKDKTKNQKKPINKKDNVKPKQDIQQKKDNTNSNSNIPKQKQQNTPINENKAPQKIQEKVIPKKDEKQADSNVVAKKQISQEPVKSLKSQEPVIKNP